MNSTLTAPAPTKRKKLVRKVSLRFFQDDANGEYGVAHVDTLNSQGGTDGFNAFWSGMGLFHDVFEHAHEHTHKYFKGYPFAMNAGGEVAAMGAMWFYYSVCGMSNRLDTNYHSPDVIVLSGTCDMMQESISEGNCSFGDTLESNVPNQKPVKDSTLEWVIDEHFNRVKATIPGRNDEQARDIGRNYKKSVTRRKLANLYRYGYRMAEKLVSTETSWNGDALTTFKAFWDKFCKAHSAEELAMRFRGIDFSIYRTDGLIEWKAEFTQHVGDYEFQPVSIICKANQNPFIDGDL